jgi:DNA-binding transcriptional MocR family regulator
VNADQLARMLGTDWSLARGRTTGAGGLARRLALGLRHLIAGELIGAGTRLPAERALAQALHVSRPTVTGALDELRAAGLVESRQGSGTWIADRDPGPRRGPAMSELVLTDHGINLAAATAPDAAHLGPLRVGLGDLLAGSPAHGYDPVGLADLRARIAARLTRQGLSTDADEILVTNGAHHALALILGALGRAGDRVIVEEHTYGGFLDLLEVTRARPVALPRDEEGPCAQALDDAIRRSQPRLVYLMPSVHAPTGAGTTTERRCELARVLDGHHAIVVVDETLADLQNGPRAPSFATLCSAACVLTVESLSKSVWGGLRVGWIRAPKTIRERLLHHRARVDLGTAIAAQRVALQIEARLDGLLDERNADLRTKAAHLQRQLAARLPSWWIPLPAGGLCLWARLPLDDASAYVQAAAREGVVVMAGTVARPDRGDDPHIRICFDRSRQILDEATARMATAWEAASTSSRPPRSSGRWR